MGHYDMNQTEINDVYKPFIEVNFAIQNETKS